MDELEKYCKKRRWVEKKRKNEEWEGERRELKERKGEGVKQENKNRGNTVG